MWEKMVQNDVMRRNLLSEGGDELDKHFHGITHSCNDSDSDLFLVIS